MHNEDTLVFGNGKNISTQTDKDRVNTFGFTEDQKKAYLGLIEFINEPFNPSDYRRALVGPGGVGKTFLLKSIIQNCNVPFSKIGISAPSHKACRVLRTNLIGTHTNVNTIQSDFGFRPNFDIEKFDERNVQFAKSGRIKVEDYSIYIIDESSMLNKSLVNYINKTLSAQHCKVIYVGDDHQIPPVNEYESTAFKGIKTYRLTQIVRQDNDNPIRKLCDMLRYDIEHYTFTFLEYLCKHHEEYDATMTKGFKVCGAAEFQRQVNLQFSDEAITHNTDYVKVIAYTNRCVSDWNKYIRETIIKDADKSVITTNDLITSYITIVDNFNDAIIRNSEDYIVKSIANYTHPKYEIKGFMVKFQAVYGGAVTSPLFVIDHRDKYSVQMYCKISKDLIEQAQNADRYKRAAKWKEYFKFKESCLLLINLVRSDETVLHYRNLDYGFSVTAHKAQGSTYNVSMVDINDIVYDKNGHPYQNAKDINKRLYVAISRAKEKVIMKYGY